MQLAAFTFSSSITVALNDNSSNTLLTKQPLTMRKHYLPVLFCFATILTHASYSQENRSIDEKGLSVKKRPIKNKISVFVSGGSTTTSGKTKDSAFIGNGWNVEAGAYIPLYNPAGFNKHLYFSLGIETGVNYAQQKANGGIATYTNNFQLQDGAINPAFETGTPHANSLQFFAGPKAQWDWGRIYISPSVLLGYFSLHRKGYTLSQTIVNPKQTTESKYIPFIAATDYSASGFIVKPKIELGYRFTEHLALFINGAIAFGPSVQNNINYWKPQGNGGTGNLYSYDQYAGGAAKPASFSSRWQATSVNAGLRYTWIKSTFDKGHGERKQRAAVQGDSNTDNVQPAAMVAGQPQSVFKADSSNNASDNNVPAHQRLSMTPTTTKQTQASSFGEKVVGGMQSGGNAAQMTAGNPIPGVVVKGGKNPPVKLIIATSDDNGEVELKNLEAGNYLFQLIAPEQPAGKGIGSAGIKRNEIAFAKPGQPIKGIIVKGGKNANAISTANDDGEKHRPYIFKNGLDTINATSNKKGEIQFTVTEAGNYILKLYAPMNK